MKNSEIKDVHTIRIAWMDGKKDTYLRLNDTITRGEATEISLRIKSGGNVCLIQCALTNGRMI